MLRPILNIITFVLALFGSSAFALEVPTGRVLLTVSGAIKVTNVPEGAQFDRAMLRALDWKQYETFNSITNGIEQFSGPTIASLMAAVQAEGGAFHAVAADDYAVEISIAEAQRAGAILALEHNGKKMSLRDRGPIWVIFPQSKSQADSFTYHPQMIWQLVAIEVLTRD